jgi:LPS-assembly protein
MGSAVRAALIVICMAACSARAADVCPAPPKVKVTRPADIAADDHRIHIDTDDAVLNIDLDAILKGRVTVRQDERSVEADEVTYDYVTDRLNVKGRVNFLDPKLRVRSDSGSYGTLGGATFNLANFDIPERNGRGYAKDINMHPDGRVDLSKVRYTTCPVGNQDWQLQADRLALDTKGQEGVAHDVIMRFKDVPVFYTPYISFPLGDERKSGVLFPSFGHSSSNGYELEVPYYFNLAPNYDLTFTPGLLSARGAQFAEDFRFLTASSHGSIDATFLPDDRDDEHDNRSYFRALDTTDIQRGLRFDTDVAAISDVNYFSDFAIGSDQTSVTFLQRRADVLYYDDAWRIRAELQNYQTIDIAIPAYDRPASRVPRIEASGLYPILDSHFEFALDSEAVNFLREAGPCQSALSSPANAAAGIVQADPCASGVRVNLAPEIRWSYRGPGYFFEPAVGYDLTQYALTNVTPGDPSDPTRALPYARLDTGLIFERDAGSQAQRTQTLEPRLVYSYVPYRNQNELPIFDSGLPDLNLTELFRTNRYVGWDRIGDANQVALALTTRLFDAATGAQYLSATIGQIRYFSLPRVGLPADVLTEQGGLLAGQAAPAPVNPLSIPGALTIRGQSFAPYPGQYYPGQYLNFQGPAAQSFAAALAAESTTPYRASDIVSEVSLTAYKHLSVDLDYQWNPYTSRTDKAEASVQYRPDSSRVINIGYRYQTGILKQVEGSFAWPIAGRWNIVGREVYSLADFQLPNSPQHQTIEQVAGFEYKSCCYRVQLVQRRYLSIRPGSTTGSGLDTSIALQLELTGLSSVGKRSDTFLEQSIRGYSTRDPNIQNPTNSP